MTDNVALFNLITSSGMTKTFIANSIGCSRQHLYDILDKGIECSASEIVAFSELLRLTKQQRDEIFLNKKVIVNHENKPTPDEKEVS